MVIKFDNGDFIRVSIEDRDHHKGWFRVVKKFGPYKGVGWWNPSEEFRYPLISELSKEISDSLQRDLGELAPQEKNV